VAGMVSLVNSARRAAGKPTLGFLNPALYALHAQFINDITVGENRCVAAGAQCCSEGFFAAPGWDPVTGLGSIDFEKFMKAMMDIPSTAAGGDAAWAFVVGANDVPELPAEEGNDTHAAQSPLLFDCNLHRSIISLSRQLSSSCSRVVAGLEERLPVFERCVVDRGGAAANGNSGVQIHVPFKLQGAAVSEGAQHSQ